VNVLDETVWDGTDFRQYVKNMTFVDGILTAVSMPVSNVVFTPVLCP
jgi:hypothetical protein